MHVLSVSTTAGLDHIIIVERAVESPLWLYHIETGQRTVVMLERVYRTLLSSMVVRGGDW